MSTTVSPPWLGKTLEDEAVNMVKKDLLRLVASGAIPADVRSFSELHDHMDANTLGGLDQGDFLARLEEEFGPADGATEGWVGACNRIQTRVHHWIDGGGLRRETCSFGRAGCFEGDCYEPADGRFRVSERPTSRPAIFVLCSDHANQIREKGYVVELHDEPEPIRVYASPSPDRSVLSVLLEATEAAKELPGGDLEKTPRYEPSDLDGVPVRRSKRAKKAFLSIDLTEVEARALLHCVQIALTVSGKGELRSVPRLGGNMYPGSDVEVAATNRVAKRLRPSFKNGVWYGRLQTEADRRRPSEEVARKAVQEYLEGEGLGDASFQLVEDGDEDSAPNKCGWAFWVDSDDTTSYVHEDLTIEWYGTTWDAGDDPDVDDSEGRDGPAEAERSGGAR